MDEQMFNEETISYLMKNAKKHLNESLNKKIKLDEIKVFIEDLMDEPDPDISFMTSLFDCAVRDLDAAKRLYNSSGISPLAIYHLQQSVEKLTKFYGLYSGKIRKEDLYNQGGKFEEENIKKDSIGHQSPKMFIMMLKEKNLQKRIMVLLRVNNQEKDLSKIVKQMNKITKKDYKIARTTKSQIKDIINFFDSIHRRVRASKNNLKSKLIKFKISFLRDSKGKVSDKEYAILEKGFSKIDSLGTGILDIPTNFLFLWYLSLLTYPHFNWTRYPHEKKNQLNPNDYTVGLGIVDVFNEITKIIERRLINRLNPTVNQLKKEINNK